MWLYVYQVHGWSPHKSIANRWQVSWNLILLFPLTKKFIVKYLGVKLFTSCFNYVVHFSSFMWLCNKQIVSICFKFRPPSSLTRNSISCSSLIWAARDRAHFTSLHFTSLHEIQILILCRFPTIDYQILIHMGSNDRCCLRTNLLFQKSANSQNIVSRVLPLFLALFLA